MTENKEIRMGLFKQIGDQFHKPTGSLGRLVTWIMNKQNKGQYDAIEHALNLSDIPDELKILDIGFGNGYLLNSLLKRYNGHYYGIDLSHDMIAACQKRNANYIQEDRLTISHGLAEQLPFEADFFDKIYTVNTSYFWESLDQVFLEIKRCLKKEGEFSLAFYSDSFLNTLPVTKTGYAKYPLATYRQAGIRHGFLVDEQEIIAGKAYVFTYQKQED